MLVEKMNCLVNDRFIELVVEFYDVSSDLGRNLV